MYRNHVHELYGPDSLFVSLDKCTIAFIRAGHPPAAVVLGDAYREGESEAGIEVNEEKAFDMYRSASLGGYTPALLKVAECYLSGKNAQALKYSIVRSLDDFS